MSAADAIKAATKRRLVLAKKLDRFESAPERVRLLEARVAVLEAQLRSLGAEPQA